MGRMLDRDGIQVEALVTDCQPGRQGQGPMTYSFDVLTTRGPETVIGRDSGNCDAHRVGGRVIIRYLESDPRVSQILQNAPWGLPLVMGSVCLLVAAVVAFPKLGELSLGVLWRSALASLKSVAARCDPFRR